MPAAGRGDDEPPFVTEDLVLAVYAREVDALIASVDQLLHDENPLDALRTWMRRLAAQSRLKHGLGEALTSANAQATIEALIIRAHRPQGP